MPFHTASRVPGSRVVCPISNLSDSTFTATFGDCFPAKNPEITWLEVGYKVILPLLGTLYLPQVPGSIALLRLENMYG